jgi:hypothetical protein
MQVFDSTVKGTLNERLEALERHFDADVVFLLWRHFASIHSPIP